MSTIFVWECRETRHVLEPAPSDSRLSGALLHISTRLEACLFSQHRKMRWFLSPYLLKIKTILICDTSWNSRKSSISGISEVAQSSNLLWVVPLPLFPLSDSRQMHANYRMAHRLTEKNKEQQQKTIQARMRLISILPSDFHNWKWLFTATLGIIRLRQVYPW